jgi:hypothetical protein
MVLWCEAGWGTAPTGCSTPPKDLIGLAFPGSFHVVDLFEFQIHFVPTIGVTPRSSVIIMTRDSNVTVTGGFGRREDREQDRESSPVREKMTVEVMRPRVVTERVISVKFGGEAELIAWVRRARENAESAVDGGCSQRVEEATGGRCGRACATVCFPHVTIAPPIWSVQSARWLNAFLCN